MRKRRPNACQNHYCEYCEKVTPHEIGKDVGDGIEPSGRRLFNDTCAYRRTKTCIECEMSQVDTVELLQEDLDSLLAYKKEAIRMKSELAELAQPL